MKAFEDLLGHTLQTVSVTPDQDEIHFTLADGRQYRLYHMQDCCESVTVEDVVGNLDDLVGLPLLIAEETSNNDNPKKYTDSWTWTFYKLATQKGHVTIRWYGVSNGYYSERVSFGELAA